MIGKKLNNRYEILSLLGEGGMAVVYEAKDLLLGRNVAVKVLRGQFAADPSFLERFQREARAAAGLSHPNIVNIYDVGSEDHVQYIIMELVRGRTLKEIVRQEGPQSAARIIDLGRQICEGLGYAHEQGLVHRDVKSHNILVGLDGRAKIADFGIAVALGHSSLTQSGVVVGTAHYLSPEQARGEPATPASDLYSAGIVLYELATGRLPFEGDTPVAVALKQVQDAPIPPRQWNPRIPESLQAVILRAMDKEPAQRFGSGRQMSDALIATARASLEATAPQRVVTSQKPSRGYVATAMPAREAARPTRRKSGGVGPMMLLLVLFLLVVGSVPFIVLAYTNGNLGRLFPALVAAPPTAQPTPQPTPLPTPAPTAVPMFKAPELVGKPFPQARQEAQSQGLEVVIVGEAYNRTYPITYVITQNPQAGTPVEKGARVEVTVSLGVEMATVPRVVGDQAPNAEGKLIAAGFRWKLIEEWSDQAPAGIVMAQDPTGDTRTDKGSEVTLTVSKGREKIAVPDLVGKPEAEAQDTIVKAGLTKTWVNYQDYTTVPPGAVISQEPKAGTLVEKGTTVYIAVRRPNPTPAATPTELPQPGRKR